jgi:hypothetical protein
MGKRLVVVASLVAAGTIFALPASAMWGCGARSVRGISSSWAAPSRDEAVESVMGSCRMEHLECKIISCSPDVDTEAAADAHWPPTAGTTYIYCGVPGRPACN